MYFSFSSNFFFHNQDRNNMVSLSICCHLCGLCCSDFCLHVIPHVDDNTYFMLHQNRESFSDQVWLGFIFVTSFSSFFLRGKHSSCGFSPPSALELMNAYGGGN